MQAAERSGSRRRQSRVYAVPAYVPDSGLGALGATLRCLLGGRVVRGPEPGRLAAAVAARLGRRYALPLNRARFAIELGLRALEVGEGDEVVVPSFVCTAVHQAILRTGARPAFADIGPDLHLTPGGVEKALTSRTRAVVVPHLFGNTAPIGDIERALDGTGIALVDDAAQSFGARREGRPVGSFGVCGIVSCGVGKSLAGTAGGLLLTDDEILHARAVNRALESETALAVARRALAYWVWHRLRRYTSAFKGASDARFSRSETRSAAPRAMSNLDAAVALEQLRDLAQSVSRRRRGVAVLRELTDFRHLMLSNLSAACVPTGIVCVLPEDGPTRAEVVDRLAAAGIEAVPGYEPLHRQAGSAQPLPNTEALADRALLLPASSRLARPRRLRALAHALRGPGRG